MEGGGERGREGGREGMASSMWKQQNYLYFR